MRERNVARDRDLREVAALSSLDEADPIAVTRGRGVWESLVVDREIDKEPVVELAVKAERILGISMFQLEIRSQPDRGQLSEEVRPRQSRAAQPVSSDIIQWREVDESHVRIVSVTSASLAAAGARNTASRAKLARLGGAAGSPQRLGAGLPRAPRLPRALEPLLDVLLDEPDRPIGAAEANRRDSSILGGVVEPGARDLQHAGDLAWLEEIRHDLTCVASRRMIPSGFQIQRLSPHTPLGSEDDARSR
jgi:hypothetical protein